MSNAVLDASAVLALLLDERGADQVANAKRGAMMTSVNACEVIERLLALGFDRRRAITALKALDLRIVEFGLDLAGLAAELKAPTRAAGLSLGDRACLALALRENAPAFTADRDWLKADISVEVRLVR